MYLQGSIEVPSLQPRCHHSAAAFNTSQGVTEVVIFGGCPKCPFDNEIASTTVLQFGESMHFSSKPMVDED